MTTPSPELREYLQWLTIEKGRSPATIEAYRRDLLALQEAVGDVCAASEAQLERYVKGLRASDKAESSVSRALASIRNFYGYLTDENIISLDPTVHLKSNRRSRYLPKPLDEEVVGMLLDSVAGSDAISLRDRALLEFLYGTGARVSEVVGLKVSDLDFDEELAIVTGKGSKQRLVPLGGAVKSALSRYLEVGGRSQLLGASKSDWLFLNARGGQLTRQGIDLVISKRALDAGIARDTISAHVFRHSCATHMLAHGADIRVVQELLGHASIATTQVYTAVAVTSLQREYRSAHPRANG